MTIRVTNEVNIYRKGLEDVKISDKDNVLFVKSDFNQDTWVTLEFRDMNITLSANALRAAIDNATNTDRF